MKRFNFPGFLLLLALLALGSCKEEEFPVGLDSEQLVAGRLAGTWAKPTQIVTPDDVPPEVFGAMRLVFTTDPSGEPAQFLAKDCPIVFAGTDATWKVEGNELDAKVSLSGVAPVDEFEARVSSASLTIRFHMGWENTDTGETGQGNFSVTLSRQ